MEGGHREIPEPATQSPEPPSPTSLSQDSAPRQPPSVTGPATQRIDHLVSSRYPQAGDPYPLEAPAIGVPEAALAAASARYPRVRPDPGQRPNPGRHLAPGVTLRTPPGSNYPVPGNNSSAHFLCPGKKSSSLAAEEEKRSEVG